MTIAAAALLASLAAMIGLLVFPPQRAVPVRRALVLRQRVAAVLAA